MRIKDCNNCANYTDFDELDNGCYMCAKGFEDNFKPIKPIDKLIERFKIHIPKEGIEVPYKNHKGLMACLECDVYKDGYNKALDIFAEKALTMIDAYDGLLLDKRAIEHIRAELKAGVEK